jgi:hypothetical protein
MGAAALESWNKGQTSIALTKLTQIHLPDPFTDPNAAERLAKAQADFDKAGTGGGHDVSNEARVPAGNPDGGQWTTGWDNSDDSDDVKNSAATIVGLRRYIRNRTL